MELNQSEKNEKENDMKPMWMKNLLESALIWLKLFNDVIFLGRINNLGF